MPCWKGKKISDGPAKVTMTLSYEDESGNISTTTKDLNLEVTEKWMMMRRQLPICRRRHRKVFL